MAANDIWVLTGKKLSGEATLQELEVLKALAASNESTKQTLAAIEQMWQTLDNKTNTKEIDKRWEAFRLKLIPNPEAPNAISKIKIKK
jgi:transmembrane sensor